MAEDGVAAAVAAVAEWIGDQGLRVHFDRKSMRICDCAVAPQMPT